jgi:hypothetical protein
MQPSSFTTRLFGQAVKGPLNLSILGGAAIAAVVLASWPIAALGGVAYAALVASDVSSAEFRKRVLRGAPARMPSPEALRDPEVSAVALRITLGKAELDHVVRHTPRRLQHHLAAALGAIDELEHHAAGLALRADELAHYLAGASPSVPRDEADRLALRAAQTTDTQARASYQAAALAARERLAALGDIATARHRALAHLARIELAIKGMPAQLVRLRALDDQASDALSGDVGAELERMTIDLRAFEQSLETLMEEPS